MTKGKSTRDAALSRLFGTDQEDSDHTTSEQGSHVSAGEDAPVDEASSLAPRTRETAQETSDRRESAATTEVAPPAEQASNEVAEEEASRQSGYLGLGKYAREDGVVERITPYIRPDQAEALRVSVARKRDPRGKDISQIIQSLLDEAGYRGPTE